MFGLLNRHDKNYSEAIKCYKNALKYDSANTQILRDLGLIQVHLRQFSESIQTHAVLYQLKPDVRIYWIAYAISFYLNEDYIQCLEVLDSHPKHARDLKLEPEEYREFLLFKAQVYQKASKCKEGLQFLESVEKFITDRISLLEIRLSLYMDLKDAENSKLLCYSLMSLNSENEKYLNALLKINDLNEFNAICNFLEELSEKYPNCLLLKMKILEYASGQSFMKHLTPLLDHFLDKGIPSLYHMLSVLDNDKKEAVHKLILQIKSGECEQIVSSKNILIWCDFFSSQHFDKNGEYQIALDLIDGCIESHPDVVEFYMHKARIHKHAGNLNDACLSLETASKLDLGDRYVNTKLTKYYLRAHRLQEAEETIGLFLRGTPEEKAKDLIDNQNLWYALERAQCYQRMGHYTAAITYFNQILDCFDTITEDQMDFHGYCQRKMTLRSYFELVSFVDNSMKHPIRIAAIYGLSESESCIQSRDLADEFQSMNIDKGVTPRRAFNLLEELNDPKSLMKLLILLHSENEKIKATKVIDKLKSDYPESIITKIAVGDIENIKDLDFWNLLDLLHLTDGELYSLALDALKKQTISFKTLQQGVQRSFRKISLELKRLFLQRFPLCTYMSV